MNTFDRKINYSNGKYFTLKDDNQLHGVGLTNIRAAVDKYKGELLLSKTDNKFVAKIMLPSK